MEQSLIAGTVRRLSGVRAKILKKQPFFGRLLLRLNFGLADCETAYTDMRWVVFDPGFVARLSDAELEFVLLHELMHCVLKHCTRAAGKLQLIYNIACDIVVNSYILDAMGKAEIIIDKSPAMHLAPDGKEGREYSAEQVYDMLLKKNDDDIAEYGKDLLDAHEMWRAVSSDRLLEAVWSSHIKTAGREAGCGSGIPAGLARLAEEILTSPKIDWRQLLHDFIQHDRHDYTFCTPDRRHSGDIIMPSFQIDIEDCRVENIWFAVDTSASVSDDALAETMGEIKSAIDQVGSLSGSISFFDCEVTPPIEFDDVQSLADIKPVGGGGTGFKAIFNSMEDYFGDDMPEALIIMTDGYAPFPDESAALGARVFWLIVESDVVPPWGEYVHVKI